MKNLTALIVVILITIPTLLFAQVFNGNLTLTTQAEVDAFNYTEVTGDLTIGNTANGAPVSDITSLQPLATLTKAGGMLSIYNNPLHSLQGLGNLSSLNSLYISRNDQLEDLQGLENLTVLYDLEIADNASLTSLQALAMVNSNLYYIIVNNNDQLQNLDGLENISSISLLFIDNNDQLQNIKGLESLSSVSILRITNNPQLQNLNGLEKVTRVGLGIIISNNDQLQSLHGLDNLIYISAKSHVDDSQSPDLQNLVNPSESDSKKLNDIGLSQQSGVSEDDEFFGLIIANNDQLQNLKGLDNLKEIDAEEGWVSISGNASLISLEGLENLTDINRANYFRISENASLKTLQSLNNLEDPGENFYISRNPVLTSLEGLGKIFSVSEEFEISENDQLQDLQGLENLTTVWYLTIENNPELETLHGLENLTRVVSSITIRNNPNLNDCCTIAKLVATAGNLNRIENNGSNCNSEEAIQENCAPMVFEGNLTLRTQTDVDAFNYTEITGKLTIGNAKGRPSDISNLQPLSTLAKLGKDLSIYYNPLLHDLQGLENLTMVEDLLIEGNEALTSFQGFNNLTSLQSLQVYSNNQLNNLSGLESLTMISEDLIIEGNAGLTSLQGLEKLYTVKNLLNISENDNLENLKGLEGLIAIGWTLVIAENPKITSMKGLDNLNSADNINIYVNDKLQNLQGLENLTTIKGSLYIAQHPQLTSLQGLENIQSIRNLTIEQNPNLNDCCAIAGLFYKVIEDIHLDNGSSCSSVTDIQESCPAVFTSFTLVDAVTELDIFEMNPMDYPVAINLLETGEALNIRANVSRQSVGSVVFTLDGQLFNKENEFPYALAGDAPAGIYHSWTPTLGRHTLTATIYNRKNGKGKQGNSFTLEFIVVDQPMAVTSFTLTGADINIDLMELKEGSEISLDDYGFTDLNVRANTSGDVGSVVFDFAGINNYRTENLAPFTLGGDSPPSIYYEVPELKTPGMYTLTATPHLNKGGWGKAGTPLTITFKVTDNQIAVARILSPSPKMKAEEKEIKDLRIIQESIQMRVFPNPSDDILQVQVAGLHDKQASVNLILYNSLGKKVWEGTTTPDHKAHIEVGNLPGGMYILKTIEGSYSHIERILVK